MVRMRERSRSGAGAAVTGSPHPRPPHARGRGCAATQSTGSRRPPVAQHPPPRHSSRGPATGGRVRDAVAGQQQRRNNLSPPNPASVESAECTRRLLAGASLGIRAGPPAPGGAGTARWWLTPRATANQLPRSGPVSPSASASNRTVSARGDRTPAGLKVAHGALAHFGASRQLLLRQQHPAPARPQERTE
jgi:hypothetical protein